MNRRKTDPPRGVLKTTTADPARYHHARYYPSPDLDPFVEHYWSVQWDLRGCDPERAETLPHPSVHIIFERNVGARVAGITRGRFSRVLEGQGGVIAAKFRPGGFRPFVCVDISTLTNKILSLSEMFGPDADTAEQRVLAATDEASRIARIEEFLRARRPVRDEQGAHAGTIVYAIAADRTILRVEDLVERYAINVRMLQRLFAKYVGVTPKWVIQRYRLHEAAERLANGGISHSDLALALGYSDQAHFTRDFKAVVGTSPAAYSRRGVG